MSTINKFHIHIHRYYIDSRGLEDVTTREYIIQSPRSNIELLIDVIISDLRYYRGRAQIELNDKIIYTQEEKL